MLYVCRVARFHSSPFWSSPSWCTLWMSRSACRCSAQGNGFTRSECTTCMTSQPPSQQLVIAYCSPQLQQQRTYITGVCIHVCLPACLRACVRPRFGESDTTRTVSLLASRRRARSTATSATPRWRHGRPTLRWRGGCQTRRRLGRGCATRCSASATGPMALPPTPAPAPLPSAQRH